jgi:hypothetical protein
VTSIRLHHPTFASCNYVVELSQPMPPAHTRTCFACSRKDAPVTHRNKAIHLRLDQNGDTFVAPGILALLRTVPTMAGLEVAPGRNAPAQIVGAVEQPKQLVILPNGTRYVPGWNKYQAEKRMQDPFEPVVNEYLERVDRATTKLLAEKRSIYIMGRRKHGRDSV